MVKTSPLLLRPGLVGRGNGGCDYKGKGRGARLLPSGYEMSRSQVDWEMVAAKVTAPKTVPCKRGVTLSAPPLALTESTATPTQSASATTIASSSETSSFTRKLTSM